MIVRKIKDEEFRRTQELFALAFEFESDVDGVTSEQLTARVRETPKNRTEVYFRERWAAFEDDDRTMMAFLLSLPVTVRFDGGLIQMGGIGGVSSLPQYRRRGAVRACFEKHLRDAYDAGQELSYLFPFSTAYYRQFGYECGPEALHYEIYLCSLPRFDVGGYTELSEQGSHLEEIKKVYEDFQKGFNLMAVREDYDYDWVRESNPAKDRVYTYVYKNDAGEPKGVMSFKKVPHGKGNALQTSHFFFSDTEGLKGLLNHCRTYASSRFEAVTFLLPSTLNISSFFPEWAMSGNWKSLGIHGMLRVINVQSILEKAAYRGDGEFTLRIHDGILCENDKTFHVSFINGRAEQVKACKDEPALDAELDITDFSRFIMGSHHPEELAMIETAKLYAPTERLAQIFYKKPTFQAEHF